VAARMEGGALEEAPGREPAALQDPVGAKRIHGVMRTGGVKTASAGRAEEKRHQRRGRLLVNPDQAHRRCGGQARVAIRRRMEAHGALEARRAPIRPHAAEKACSSLAKGHRLTEERATTRRSHAAGSSSWCLRKASLNRRFARLRWTAGPTAWVDATKQALRSEGSSLRGNHHIEKAPQSTRVPCWRTARISPWRRICCAGRRRMGPESLDQTTVRRLRPFRRRAASALRPPRVELRARKPIFRARFLRCGRKVGCMDSRSLRVD
jgi:hypothetical protein